MAEIEKVLISFIETGERGRSLNEARVPPLMQSIEAIGLQTPISVWLEEQDGGDQRVHLVAGLHRLEAAKRLGWEKIDAIYVEMDEIDRQLWEIDENLCRSELTEAEEAQHLARRKELWGAREMGGKNLPTHDASGRRKTPQQERGFAADTASVTGQSKRLINKKISRATSIEAAVLESVKGTELDKGVVLDQLAKVPRELQHAKVIELRDRQETEKLNRYADKAIARSAADEAAEIIHANLDLDTVDVLVARLAGVSMKDFIAAIAYRRAA